MKCSQCGFDNPGGFAFCGKCGTRLTASEDQLTPVELDHLRAYLPSALIETLQYEPAALTPDLIRHSTDHLYRLLDTITTYLPAYIVDRILRDPTPGQTAGHFVDGSLLFADISGFTAMSERLSRTGREGAEEITSIINRYFSAMLSILRDYDGYLTKFGGDALLGLFLEPYSIERAVQAAVGMQAAMSAFAELPTSQGVFPLQMKIGLRRGRFFSAQLGTAQDMEHALFGADVNATAAAESTAAAAEVLIDRASLEAIELPCQTRSMPGRDPYVLVERVEARRDWPRAQTLPTWVAAPTLAGLRRAVRGLDALTPYLPAGLLARLASSPHAITQEGEHRLVAVLFAKVYGLGEMVDRLGPGREAELIAALNQYFVGMNETISQLGGVVNKIDLAEHGDKLLAFFGAPLAHEDDAERAVRAALNMQAALNEMSAALPAQIGLPDLRLRQQIGISFGSVFAGYVGTTWRREYTVMGDEVNLAARLMAVADPGSIVVSGSIRSKLQPLFDLEPRGDVRVKGRSEPVTIFSIAGARAKPEPLRGLKGIRSPLVGRNTEWTHLLAALDHLRAGRGQIISIVGEAGLGKSRLTAELHEHLAQSDAAADHAAVRWFEGRCVSFYESVSYRPFQELIGQMLGLQSDDNIPVTWRKLRGALDAWPSAEAAGASLPYLASFLGLPLDAALQDKVRYLSGEALQRRTFVAIRTLIEVQAKATPLALVLDDIHWMDQASLDLLEYLMPLVDLAPIMLLLLYRPERAKGCWQIREKATREFAHCATEILLDHLTPDETQQLLANLINLTQWPASVRELILGRVEGNPLYLEEVLRTLIDNQALIRDEQGQWQILGDLAAVRVPDTLQGVMMARLDRLEESPRQTAQVASVVGRSFPYDVLAHVADREVVDLNPCLVRLQQHEIVREDQRTPELIYAFQHGLMQEVCYESLLARTRREYHRKITQYLEASRPSQSSRTDGEVALLAHHAFAGQDWPRALTYQMQIGHRAQRLFANHEAIDHFRKALQSTEHLPPPETIEPRMSIRGALGELLTMTGQYEQALEHLNVARALAIERVDRDAQAHLCRWLGRLHELRGDYPVALDWIRQGLEILSGRETADAAEMLITSGLIYSRQGDYDSALDRCQESMRMAQRLDEVTVLARAYNLLGHLTRLLGQSAMAIEDFQAAFELYERTGDIQGQAIAQNQIANAYFDTGQWRPAADNYGRARAAFDLLGDVYNRAFVDNNLGGIALNQGRLDEALDYYQSALVSLERIGGSEYVLGALHNNLGAAFIRRGEIDVAREHLRASSACFEQAHSRDFLAELQRHFAEAALASGDLGDAENHAQQALQLAHELTMRGEEGNTLRVLGEISLAQHHWDEAEQWLRAGLAILESTKDAYEAARTRLALARVDLTLGRRETAWAALEQCLDVFTRLSAQLDLAAVQTLREEIQRTAESN